MKQSCLVLLVTMLVLTVSCQELKAKLGSKLKSMEKPTSNGVGLLISGIQTFGYDVNLNIQTSAIDSYSNQKLHYASNGPYRSTSRALLFNLAHFMNVVMAATSQTFTPYEGLTSLKFGTNYQRIHIEQNVKNEGVSIGKITAMEGKRVGTNVQYVAGYGWSYGTMKPQFTHHRYRKCRRILFWNKCSWATTSVKRGLQFSEIQQITDLLHNNVYRTVSQKMGAARMLNMGTSASNKNMQLDQNVRAIQTLTKVPVADVFPAVASMLNGRSLFSKESLVTGRKLSLDDGFGSKHTVHQKFTNGGSKVTLKIITTSN